MAVLAAGRLSDRFFEMMGRLVQKSDAPGLANYLMYAKRQFAQPIDRRPPGYAHNPPPSFYYSYESDHEVIKRAICGEQRCREDHDYPILGEYRNVLDAFSLGRSGSSPLHKRMALPASQPATAFAVLWREIDRRYHRRDINDYRIIQLGKPPLRDLGDTWNVLSPMAAGALLEFVVQDWEVASGAAELLARLVFRKTDEEVSLEPLAHTLGLAPEASPADVLRAAVIRVFQDPSDGDFLKLLIERLYDVKYPGIFEPVPTIGLLATRDIFQVLATTPPQDRPAVRDYLRDMFGFISYKRYMYPLMDIPEAVANFEAGVQELTKLPPEDRAAAVAGWRSPKGHALAKKHLPPEAYCHDDDVPEGNHAGW